ncbi:flagellar motor protein MotB [uncultured Arcobacter sp.]|mgnify:CR=1 FL=1|jgi:chemotaxis protein MotB|uniref:OmpA/MotB family protein n=1 Tax=uncultured Arcobacter sp. TaxID=165434 RepID=UPI00262B44F2|nr:flagellar motor protein MotB [uncultured Arcobacter sp.]
MADKKCPDCPKCLPGWLVQFGDLMSLLLTFFILLLSMAVMDKKKVEEYFEIMRKAMGFLDQTQDTVKRDESTNTSKEASNDADSNAQDTQSAVEEMTQIAEEINEQTSTMTEQVQITEGNNEFTLDIPSSLMFGEGEYTLENKSAKRFISKIARVIRTMPQTFDIEIIGHTDRSNFTNDTIPRDGWDISALRSISVVKELIKNRIDPAQLKVSAYSSYRPKSENAAENRRVELRFVSSTEQKNILEKENFFDRLEQ